MDKAAKERQSAVKIGELAKEVCKDNSDSDKCEMDYNLVIVSSEACENDVLKYMQCVKDKKTDCGTLEDTLKKCTDNRMKK